MRDPYSSVINHGYVAITIGSDTAVFRPSIGPGAKAVHRAVQMDGRYLLMGLGDSIYDCGIFDVGCAFVMNDHIVFLSPIKLSIQRQDQRSR